MTSMGRCLSDKLFLSIFRCDSKILRSVALLFERFFVFWYYPHNLSKSIRFSQILINFLFGKHDGLRTIVNTLPSIPEALTTKLWKRFFCNWLPCLLAATSHHWRQALDAWKQHLSGNPCRAETSMSGKHFNYNWFDAAFHKPCPRYLVKLWNSK